MPGDAGGEQVQNDLPPVVHHGVARVVPALVADDVGDAAAEDVGGLLEDGGERRDEDEPHLQQAGVLLTEDRRVVVILVELLGQFVGIVRNEGRRKGRGRLGDLLGIAVQEFDETDLLRTEFDTGGNLSDRMHESAFLRLA